MNRFSCIIVDDEPLARQLVEAYIGKVPFLELKGSFAGAMDALLFMKQHPVHLLFLDIQMPDINGLQLLKSLQLDIKTIIITAYAEYAVEGFDLDVTDYLLKPVRFERFLKAVNKFHTQETVEKPTAKEEPNPSDNVIFVKADYKTVKINIPDITYIESLREYIAIHTRNSKTLTLQSMKRMEEILPKDRFIRIHKSYLVAITQIDTVMKNMLRINGVDLPIGETYRAAFLAMLNQRKIS
ncbi:MAG TPA: LytTR family DNA-binding domain-containing protein [Chitinophaga sp.]|uniref:LytR/AlgR family response regulator transcription factor n=1 Tax=Chitinophaga sp. TaxID=1869181 RepID=UPI002B6A22C7|nr:LytTR family DNA-binding domain-containing protein [Chitinophaga sp.]HVI45029.1 LytTR family DNA-binding domain-containing protein [Chitinophaga sp.]